MAGSEEVNYSPTRAGRALYMAMADPESLRLTNIELARRAGISEKRFYDLMGNPMYRAWVNEQRQRTLNRYVDQILTASVKTAAKDGREGHQDRRMLLEMTGLYQPKGVEGGGGNQPLTIIIGGSNIVGGVQSPDQSRDSSGRGEADPDG